MTGPQIPDELKDVVSSGEWEKSGLSSKVGHRTVIFEYPNVVRDFISKKIFTFKELLEFAWQELQVLCIDSDQVKDLVSKGFSPKEFHKFDSLQLIEILHQKDNFLSIIEEGISCRDLARFSAHQMLLILQYPRAVSLILKQFKTTEDLLKLRWNWVEEMLVRPEQTLSLLEHGVAWEQLVNLPDWDFGWFLQHVPEIIKLIDIGVEFDTIAKINTEKLRESPSFQPLFDKGVAKDDLEKLNFWQMFMILSHRDAFLRLIDRKVSKELLFKFDSHNLERVLENLDFFLSAYKNDPEIFREAATLKHSKMNLLLRHRQEFLSFLEKGAGLKDVRSLPDRHFETVLERMNDYIPMIQIAGKLDISYEKILEIDLEIIAQLTNYPEEVAKLIKSGLDINDLARYPLILQEILRHADGIVKLKKSGISPKDLFTLSKDQIVYAFSRFPLLEIIPELQMQISDLEPFFLEEFKVALSNLKSLSLLKKGGVKMNELAEIRLPRFQIILNRPDTVLPLIQQGIPLYRFSRIEADKLKLLLADPLSDEAQELIQTLRS
jgi:hypothetical protein